MKVNNMCSYPGFKAISGERAHGDGRFSVNFGPMKLVFGPVERGEQGLSNELLVLVLLGVPNIQGPIMGQICFFFRAPENTPNDRKRHPVADGP